jgi:F-type H+-transporting ATPase subunit c
MKFWITLLVTVGMTLATVAVASAQTENSTAAVSAGGATAKAPAESSNKGMIALAAGLAIALAALGGALGQGRAAASALEGIARNPGARKDIFVPFILGLALIESLVIYALIIALMLTLKVG